MAEPRELESRSYPRPVTIPSDINALVDAATTGDRRALDFVDSFEGTLINQSRERRSIGDTIGIGWSLLETLPREELTRISEEAWEARSR